MANQSICGSTIRHRRGMLALIWTLISIVTLISMGTAAVYTLARKNNGIYYNYNDDYNAEEGEEGENGNGNGNNGNNGDDTQRVAMTSEGLTFCAVWTALVSLFVAIFGTVVLGFQGPRQYYSCCASTVMRTSQLTLGVFMGILIMFSNLTLICSFIFREYMMKSDFYSNNYGGEEQDNEECGDENGDGCNQNYVEGFVNVERTANLFSMVCLFITALHGAFACVIFMFQESILAEHTAEQKEESLEPSDPILRDMHYSASTLRPGGGGYVGPQLKPNVYVTADGDYNM